MTAGGWNWTGIFKGAGGEYEVNRVVGAIGTVAYTVCANAFVGWNIWEGRPFDVTAYCLAFPAGLAACIGGIAGAVALKDRQVATATVIRETGAVPVAPPIGPEVPVKPDE